MTNDDDPETIIHARAMASCNRFKKLKACYKDITKELIPLPPTRWWDWCMSEDEKKK